MPVNISASLRTARGRCAGRRRAGRPTTMRPAPHVGDGRRARAGEQRPGVVAAEQRGREVERRSGRRGRRGGTRRRPSRRPRPAPAATPRRPELVEHVAERRPSSSSARVHLGVRRAPGRARPAAGRGPSTWRTVSAGSSARTVPAPTMHGVALGPQPVGVGPGRVAGDPLARAVGRGGAPVERARPASARPTAGRCVRCFRYGRELGPHLVGARRRPRPRCPRRAAGRCPRPRPAGRGPRCRRRPGRRRPRSIASAHGGVRPWCEHGSSVVKTVGPAGRARRPPPAPRPRRGGRPGGSVAPSKTSPPGGLRSTQPDPRVRRRASASASGGGDRPLHQAPSLALVLTSSSSRSVRDRFARTWTRRLARASRRPLPRSHPDSPLGVPLHDDAEHRRPWDSTRSANGPKAEGSRALTAGQDSHPYPARGGISFGCAFFLTGSVRTTWSRWQRSDPKRPIASRYIRKSSTG